MQRFNLVGKKCKVEAENPLKNEQLEEDDAIVCSDDTSSSSDTDEIQSDSEIDVDDPLYM